MDLVGRFFCFFTRHHWHKEGEPYTKTVEWHSDCFVVSKRVVVIDYQDYSCCWCGRRAAKKTHDPRKFYSYAGGDDAEFRS